MKSKMQIAALSLGFLAAGVVGISNVMAESAEGHIQGSIHIKGVAARDLPKFAKISMAQARRAASEGQPGKILAAALEREDGFLVYSVQIASPRGNREILVDAGNGKVLSNLPDENSENHDEKDDD